MVQFSKLRLQGFKSFVEKTELDIADGMNGVVGPNGCGKSNLVEALRWVMGENSAKRMRGAGMEDVIFSGTDKRSARNIAEVSLLLDNSDRTAPAAYNGQDEIEISRRIERDKGSQYRINGKHVRARDVQMFFADSVSGASSPALVSQGRITEIIKAKPLERRLILEDSAGISGLFVRRHEAELKLRAADNNLLRIEDVLTSMETRLNALQRQAKQASRYKNINAQIRQLDIAIALVEYADIQAKITENKALFAEAESQAAVKLTAVTQLTKTQNTQMEDLPALRKVEAEIAAALQVKKLALQRVEDEAKRHAGQLREAQEQIVRLENDQRHEQNSLEETDATLTKITAQQKTIIESQAGSDGIRAAKQQERDGLESKVLKLEEQYNALMQGVAETKARRGSLEQQIAQNNKRIETVEARQTASADELAALSAADSDSGVVAGMELEIVQLGSQVADLGGQLDTARSGRDPLMDVRDAAEVAMRTGQKDLSDQQTEIGMLEQLFDQHAEQDYAAVLDQVTPEGGFEKALSRALGDNLMASLESDAPSYWQKRDIADLPALPAGADALAAHVEAPDELALALSQIGYIENEAVGKSLALGLKPGQSLVSAAGTYWRWDGLCVRADAADRNAVHLEQKNKLAALKKSLGGFEVAAEKTAAAYDSARDAFDDIEVVIASLANDLRLAENLLNSKQIELAQAKEKRARLDSQVLHLKEAIALAEDDLKTLRDVVRWDRERLEALDDAQTDQNDQSVEAMRAELMDVRSGYNNAVRAFDRFVQEQNSMQARLRAIADERVNINNRNIRARERLKELAERYEDLQARLADLKDQPVESRDGQEHLLHEITMLDKKRMQAADDLTVAEKAVHETVLALKEAESALGCIRERRAHTQATLASVQEQDARLTGSINEQFSMAPAELATHLSMDIGEVSFSGLKGQKEGLVRDRERIGAVNLRAEDEAAELDAEVGTMIRDRNELVEAIAELRGGIETINKEARERLVAAFDLVNGHFQRLFERLFVGGKAHLALVDSDDPLEAGLEIFAQPPGKALQSLSLLSGGEQTMASIALIFGMFLTNPSPICVLDEIDAPLDDSNVDRVCGLLEEIAALGETRFLVITHHRLTMARMDRLYGVTMAERGISQLVSVDLQQSFEFVEAA